LYSSLKRNIIVGDDPALSMEFLVFGFLGLCFTMNQSEMTGFSLASGNLAAFLPRIKNDPRTGE